LIRSRLFDSLIEVGVAISIDNAVAIVDSTIVLDQSFRKPDDAPWVATAFTLGDL
jgi:hypothetical protein